MACALCRNAFLMESGARVTLSHESLAATIRADAIILLPRALFVRLFTAFACMNARGPMSQDIREYVSTESLSRPYVLARVHRYIQGALYERHGRISKCTGSRNNAKSHGCVYILEHERAGTRTRTGGIIPVNIHAIASRRSREKRLARYLPARFLRTNAVILYIRYPLYYTLNHLRDRVMMRASAYRV